MSTLEGFAKDELEKAGLFDKDSDYGGMIGVAVMDLIKLFAEQGHSRMSAARTRSIFNRVANYLPLTPLSGKDDEWVEIGDNRFQNKRCPSVFKKDGQAYNSEGRVFRDASGCCFTNKDSKVPVVFPYVPKTEYVDVIENSSEST